MLIHHLTRGAPEWRSAGHHLPERHAERVKIRTGVQGESGELFGTSKFRCSDKTSWRRNCGLETRFGNRLRQTEIDNFGRDTAAILQTHHDVSRFDVPVNKVLFVNCGQSGSRLRCNFERKLYFESSGAFNEIFECFSLHKLHRIEVTAPNSAKVQYRGNV